MSLFPVTVLRIRTFTAVHMFEVCRDLARKCLFNGIQCTCINRQTRPYLHVNW